MTATKNITDETLITDFLESPQGLKALHSRGILTVADLKVRTLDEIRAIPGVGEHTLQQITALAVCPAGTRTDANADLAESNRPILLRSKYKLFCLQILPGDAIPMGAKGLRQIPPVVVAFQGGLGQITQRAWFVRKYKRDEKEIAEAIKRDEPWRVEAGRYLRTRNGFRRDFFIMSD